MKVSVSHLAYKTHNRLTTQQVVDALLFEPVTNATLTRLENYNKQLAEEAELNNEETYNQVIYDKDLNNLYVKRSNEPLYK